MGGGGGNPCTRGGSGSVNPSNKPAPPRNGGQYQTKALNPAYGVPTRDTGCGNAGVTYNCTGGEYRWSGKGCPCAGSNGAICANALPFADMCPTIGPLTQTDWSGQQVVCNYSSVNANLPINELSKYFSPETATKISNDRCAGLDYMGLSQSSECQQFYGGSVDNELLKRIDAIAGWSGNAPLMGYVNSKLKQTNSAVADQQKAQTLVQKNCDGNPMDPKCGCYNVTKFGNRCLNDATVKTYPGCKELAAAMADLPAAAQIGTMNMFCASNECANAKASDESLLPGPNPPTCPMNIAQCVNDFRNANLTGSPVSAVCQNTITGVPSKPPPPPPPPPPPSGGGSPPPPPPSGGGSTPPPPPSGGAAPASGGGSAGVMVATSASPDSKKGLIMGLGFGGACLFLICILIAIFFIMKKKGVKTA